MHSSIRRRFHRYILVALVVVLLPVRATWAWVDTGHKIVALVAWEDLTPKTRQAVTDLLKKHPRYEKDLLGGLPEGSTPAETDLYAFATAATWPDIVRSPANPMQATHNHPSWHYIDLPVLEGVSDPTTAESPASTTGATTAPAGPKNVVEALTQSTANLKEPAGDPGEKAVDLCWIEHLVGDVHQPLHCASMFSDKFPKGDRGGNSQELLRDPPYPNSRENLHLIWDQLPGNFKSIRLDEYEANGLRLDPELSREKLKPLLAVTDFMAWAQEGHNLAEHVAYLDGHLDTAVVKKGGRGGGGDTPGVPPGYIEKAENVAMHQIALAGYRLADLLNSIYDPRQ